MRHLKNNELEFLWRECHREAAEHNGDIRTWAVIGRGDGCDTAWKVNGRLSPYKVFFALDHGTARSRAAAIYRAEWHGTVARYSWAAGMAAISDYENGDMTVCRLSNKLSISPNFSQLASAMGLRTDSGNEFFPGILQVPYTYARSLARKEVGQ